jgi:hypothetical protein
VPSATEVDTEYVGRGDSSWLATPSLAESQSRVRTPAFTMRRKLKLPISKLRCHLFRTLPVWWGSRLLDLIAGHQHRACQMISARNGEGC